MPADDEQADAPGHGPPQPWFTAKQEPSRPACKRAFEFESIVARVRCRTEQAETPAHGRGVTADGRLGNEARSAYKKLL